MKVLEICLKYKCPHLNYEKKQCNKPKYIGEDCAQWNVEKAILSTEEPQFFGNPAIVFILIR